MAKSASRAPAARPSKTNTIPRNDARHRSVPLPEETGAVYKDWGGRIAVALTMPNTYYVGMSSLALQLLYRAFNAEPDVVCERIFWEKGAAQAGKPLLSLENERPRR
jgi:hypothetical protein